jgi:hypothetical protein
VKQKTRNFFASIDDLFCKVVAEPTTKKIDEQENNDYVAVIPTIPEEPRKVSETLSLSLNSSGDHDLPLEDNLVLIRTLTIEASFDLRPLLHLDDESELNSQQYTWQHPHDVNDCNNTTDSSSSSSHALQVELAFQCAF